MLAEDCIEPPCCPHEMTSLAAENPRAALFVAYGRTAVAGSEGKSNLWAMEPAWDLDQLDERRRAARACGGSCFTLQIAHALQAHPLHASPMAALSMATGSKSRVPRRRLQWMAREQLAEHQEVQAAARQGEHSGLLKAARRAAGGRTVVAARDGRTVSGPAAYVDLERPKHAGAATERAGGTIGAATRTSETFSPATSPASAASAAGVALSHSEGIRADVVSAATDDRAADVAALADVEADAQRAAAHPAVLGSLLLAARRTLLVAPAAEAMSAALEHARSRGLPASLVQRLRDLLPYRTAQEMSEWLDASAKEALLSESDDGTAEERAELKMERLGGEVQRAAHARGLLLVVVRASGTAASSRTSSAASVTCAPLPEGRACLAAAAAAAAGGLLLTEALKLQLEPRTVCQLRTALAATPLLGDSRQHKRWWRIAGGQLVAGSSAARRRNSEQVPSSAVTTNASAASWLDELLPAAVDVLGALEAAAAELQRRGLCANPEYPIVLDGPTGAASRVAACAVRSTERKATEAAASRGCAAPLVRCADGSCRQTFVHCYRVLASSAYYSSHPALAADQPDLLAGALPACASSQRQRRLEKALPEAADLLSALASFDVATRELFPQLCPASIAF